MGTSDDGFRIENALITGGNIDFDILPGTFYVGGLRLQLDEQQTFRLQTDNLQSPNVAAPGAAGRYDLVYLSVYQSAVSAVEDRELYEVALGGPDTTQRMRLYQVVNVLPDVGRSDCGTAWDQLIEQWAADQLGTLNAEYERVVDTRLTVTYSSEGVQNDLCEPPVGGGYLGAENQAIRVQLVSSTQVVWGFNNAAPLYRVQLSADRRTVTLLTPPKDEFQQPLAGQTVEILPWSALLPNGEITAGLTGHLSRVDASYDPVTGQLVLQTAVPTAGFDDWQSRSDAPSLMESEGISYFLRLWHRGADIESDPAVSFTPGMPLDLGYTGIQVTITGNDRAPGDHWIIAARPETPDQVVPWELENGRAPHGVRRFFAPLAVIRWRPSGSVLITDCRTPFRPLTHQNTCCTYTVGDGVNSFGDLDSIEDALERLPESGGEICVLPGTHTATLILTDRQNITICGCSGRAIVLPQINGQPVIAATGCENLKICGLDIVTVDSSAIVVADSVGVRIDDNRILAYINAIDVEDSQQVEIVNNTLRMIDKAGGDVAIFALGEDMLIENNDLLVVPDGTLPPPPEDPDPDDDVPPPNPTDPCLDPQEFYLNLLYLYVYIYYVWTLLGLYLRPQNPYKTLGGIQIGSGSERVTVRGNHIAGGAGNGITLGSDLRDTDFGDGAGEAEVAFTQRYATFDGRAVYNNRAVGDQTIFMRRSTGETETIFAESDGQFYSKLEEGEYVVSVADPQYRVSRVVVETENELGQPYYRVELTSAASAALAIADVLAFIYDVTIESNTIANMGLSGIGMPLLDEALIKELGAAIAGTKLTAVSRGYLQVLLYIYFLTGTITGFVIRLTIYRNHITGCLQNVNLPEAPNALLERGVGGVSLGLSEQAIIEENVIEDNGVSHYQPVCGIFASYTSGLDISANHITNNGPLIAALGQIDIGPRGGIVLPLCATITLPDFLGGGEVDAAGVRSLAPTRGRHAARISDNYVVQPVGPALTLNALGSTAISGNQFYSDLALPAEVQLASSGLLSRIMGSARIGGVSFMAPLVSVFNLGRALILDFLTGGGQKASIVPASYPDGNILFADNQLRLGASLDHTSIVALVSLDDIGMSGNQIEVLNGSAILSTAALYAITVRATNNRFKEPLAPLLNSDAATLRFSLVSLSLTMNTVADNQGHYCILAVTPFPSLLREDNNISIIGNTICEAISAVLNKQLQAAIAQMLGTSFTRTGGIANG